MLGTCYLAINGIYTDPEYTKVVFRICLNLKFNWTKRNMTHTCATAQEWKYRQNVYPKWNLYNHLNYHFEHNIHLWLLRDLWPILRWMHRLNNVCCHILCHHRSNQNENIFSNVSKPHPRVSWTVNAQISTGRNAKHFYLCKQFTKLQIEPSTVSVYASSLINMSALKSEFSYMFRHSIS